MNRLIELYNQLEKLQQSGKDVVYEIEKEINNIELDLLQNSIIPTIAKSLANRLKPFTCQVEVSLQYDGDGKVKYSFGKSGSMVFVQNEVEANVQFSPNITPNTPNALKQSGTFSYNVVDKTFGSVNSLYGYKEYLKSRNYSSSTRAHYERWLLRVIRDGLFSKYSEYFENCSDKSSYLAAINSFIEVKEIMMLNIKSHNSLNATLHNYIDYIFNNLSTPIATPVALEPSCDIAIPAKTKRGALKVTYPNGTVIMNINNSTETFLKVINDHYPDLIQDIGIFHSGYNLIMDKPVKGLERRQKFLAPNRYVFVSLNTEQKAEDLRKISDALSLNLKVEVIPMFTSEEYVTSEDDVTSEDNMGNNSISKNGSLITNNVAERSPSIVDSISDVADFIREFSSMKTHSKNGFKSPQKAILLITILIAILKNKINENRISLDAELITQYNYFWRLLVPKSFPFNCNIYHPFIHLNSDPFYKLNLKKPIADININWSLPLINSHCYNATLTPNLYQLAKNLKTCKILIDTLISQYGLLKKDLFSNHKIITPACNKNASLSGFKNFLATVETETAKRRLSPSSISVYSSGTKSKYLVSFIKKHESSGDLFNITNISIINKLIAEVTDDIKTYNMSSKVPIYILKLYRSYIQSLSN